MVRLLRRRRPRGGPRRPPGSWGTPSWMRVRRRMTEVYLSNNYRYRHTTNYEPRGGYRAFFDLKEEEYDAHRDTINIDQTCIKARWDENEQLIVVTEHKLKEIVRHSGFFVFYGEQTLEHPPMSRKEANERFPPFFDCNGNFKRKSVHWREF
jgi:hypothetical protein